METLQRAQPLSAPVIRVKALTIPPGVLPTLRVEHNSKELIDTLLAAVLFVTLSPVIIASLILVRLTSRGPSIYSQTRLGRGGVPFIIYKIRTMRQDAEKDGQARWATANDNRITFIGKILRATHIDELPQLWNVLRGEMSLVGPRPERPEIIERLRKVVPHYDDRLLVKPGLTGLAQIHLPPDETTEDVQRKLVYDRFYTRRASFSLDLRILACTALKLLGLRRLYQRNRTR